jgi:chemosensory pili system protein ChpA (sensor histidine kinase/response regulator)
VPGERIAVDRPEESQEAVDRVAGDLLGSFLDEAQRAVAGIAAALAEPAPDAAGRLKLLAHRLRGSAAMFGFPRLSRLAGAMEDVVEALQQAGQPGDDATESAAGGVGGATGPLDGLGAPGRRFLDEAAAALARTVADIAAGGNDEAAELAAVGGAAFDPAELTPAGDAGEAGDPEDLAEDGIARELQRFAAANPDVLEYFGPEAEEHVEAMAAALADITRQGPAADRVATLFRAVHTLKGAAYTVGCGPIARLTHAMEDVLAPVRGGSGWRDAALPALSEGVEALRLLVAATTGPGGRPLAAAARRALGMLGAALPPGARPQAPPEAAAAFGPPGAAGAFAPPSAAGTGTPMAPAAPSATGALWAPEAPWLPGGAPEAPAAPAFRSSIRVSIDRIDRLMSLVGELVIARGRLDRRLERLAEAQELAQSRGARMSQAVEEFGARHLFPQLQGAAAANGPGNEGDAGDGAPATSGIATSGIGSLARVPAGGAGDRWGAGTVAGIASLGASRAATTAELFAELEFDRYDDFNLLARRTAEIAADLGELHGEIARLTTLVRDDAGQLQRLVRDLRGGIGRARMVPIGQLFARFGRLVAATAAAAGKRVELELEGEAVEVDTAVAEAIADPLMHLVQNAVIHGVETPDLRRSRGKPEQGLLLLRAHLQGRFILVEVEDDGGGIDLDALHREAAARGLRSAAALSALDREQTLELVFLPGLSTSPRVTQTAGRGVGMDVVRTNLNRLGGEIAIETEAGTGTRFTLKAPLTLLISEALFLRVGEEIFAVPVTAVRRMHHAMAAELAAAAGGGEELLLRGGEERLSLLRLDRLFRLPGRRAEPWLPVVVLAAGGRSCALAVDELLGVEEVVIKGLGELLEGLPLFSGAIVTAEGKVVLLLDATAFTLASASLPETSQTAEAVEAEAGSGPPVSSAPAIAAQTAGTAGAGGAAGAAGALAAGPAAAASGSGARRLLLVDDSVSVRKAVGQMLGRHGYQVTAVADGEEALEALRLGSFDAVLTDLEMPRLNGYELIEEIRRGPRGGKLPIVVITTRAGGKHLDLARRLGATACFGKPFDQAALLALLGGLAARSDGGPW